MVPVNPVVPAQEVRFKIPSLADDKPVSLYLSVAEAGDGPANDFVVWRQPRLVAPGRPDLLLRDVRPLIAGNDGPPRSHSGLDGQGAAGR